MGLIDDVRGDVWVVPVAGGEPRRRTADDGVISFPRVVTRQVQVDQLYGTFSVSM